MCYIELNEILLIYTYFNNSNVNFILKSESGLDKFGPIHRATEKSHTKISTFKSVIDVVRQRLGEYLDNFIGNPRTCVPFPTL